MNGIKKLIFDPPTAWLSTFWHAREMLMNTAWYAEQYGVLTEAECKELMRLNLEVAKIYDLARDRMETEPLIKEEVIE